MGGITTTTGLVSGINTAQIIDQLISIESRPKTQLQSRIERNDSIRIAFTELQTRLTSLRLNTTTLKRPTSFQTATVNSSNSNVLTGTASNGTVPGTYQFQVAKLTSAQQAVSSGFTSDSAKVGAGTLTLELGGGELTSTTNLADLNGGTGVRRGSFKITDRSGASAVVDISSAVTLEDVTKRINTALGVSVKAEITKTGLKISDTSGGSTSNLKIADLSGGNASLDLGIRADVASGTITGTGINSIGTATSLSRLNDGRGLRLGSGTDFVLTARDGTTTNIDVGDASTVGQLIDTFNAAAGGKAVLSIAPNGKGFRLQDTSGGSGALALGNGATGKAATDIGLALTTSTSSLTGKQVLSDLGTVLLSSLNGGQGLELGTIGIINRAAESTTVDLSAASTVQDVIDLINDTGVAVASLKPSGNGIQIVDDSGLASNLTITDEDSTNSATLLGVAGVFGGSSQAVGKNLQRQYINENTLLSTYNGGRGVPRGKFRITDATGRSAEVDLTQGNETRLSDVISEINSRGLSVLARINDQGDGLLLESTGGAGQIRVEDTSGAAAAALRISGTSVNGKLDGTFEKTITTTAADTVATLRDKINNLGFAASATIINDGAAGGGTRLNFSARDAGLAGRFIIDGGNTLIRTTNLVNAQDSAVFLGSSGSANPVLISSSRNQLTGVVPGLTLDLVSASDSPVTVNIGRSAGAAVETVKTLVETFNGLIDKIKEQTSFDPQTNKRGLLLGDASVRTVEQNLFSSLSRTFTGVGRFRSLAEVGLKVVSGTRLEFDEDKFKSAYATDPEAVTSLFTAYEQVTTTTVTTGGVSTVSTNRVLNGTATEGKTTTAAGGSVTTTEVRRVGKGFATLLEDSINKLIDVTDGVIPKSNQSLDRQNLSFQGRISQLDKLITAKRQRLERQFANMESILANLQSQGNALSQIQTITPRSNNNNSR